MKFDSSLRLFPMTAMIGGAFSAQAATNWAQTQPRPVTTSTATESMTMQDGEGIHIAISLQVRDKTGLDALSEAVIAGRMRPISSAEFMSRFAPSQSNVNAVVTHLKKAGFINIEVAPNNMLITAEGSADTVKAAFNVGMKVFNANGLDDYAGTSNVLVPQELSGIVLAVHGLQTVHMAPMMLSKAEGVTAGPDARLALAA
jgi:pseudomonalisin/xanthomonalisin